MKFIVLGKKHLIALGLVLLVGVFVLLAAAQGMSQFCKPDSFLYALLQPDGDPESSQLGSYTPAWYKCIQSVISIEYLMRVRW